jgi:D-threo-aldose 1-dehydrogenase
MAESVSPALTGPSPRDPAQFPNCGHPTRSVNIDDTPFGFGGAPLGNLFAPIADEAAVALVRSAYISGVRYFDTAPHYGSGLSEHRIGAALRAAPRGDFLLSTKVGRLLIADPDAPRNQNSYVGVLPFVQRWDYSFDGTLRSIEDSLQRLSLAAIDYAFVHDVARDAHGDAQPQRFREAMDGAIPALARLKAAGAIKGYGLGVNDWQVCVDALAHADLDILLLAGRYTLLDQTALPELLPRCVARGVRVVVGGPFNSGILASGTRPAGGGAPYFDYAPAPAAVVARAAAIEKVCATHGVALKAAALQFPRAHPAVACVLPGARSVGELADNLALSRVPIPAAFWRELRISGLVAADAPLPAGAPG